MNKIKNLSGFIKAAQNEYFVLNPEKYSEWGVGLIKF